MKIQRFEGKDVTEALRMAQKALGPDAVILQTRRVPGSGLRGLVTRPRIEVLAAVDIGGEGIFRPPQQGGNGNGTVASVPSPLERPRGADEREHLAQRPPGGGVPLAAGARGDPAPVLQREAGGEPPPTSSTSAASRETPLHAVGPLSPGPWQSEWEALRREVADLRLQLLQLRGRSPGAAPGTHGSTPVGTKEEGTRRPDYRPARSLAAEPLPPPVSAGASLRDPPGAGAAGAALATRTIELKEGLCTAVALVGPTGVGKTTTIAKLAAVAIHVEHRRVAFIALSTDRIGGVEPLERYARRHEIPLSVARSAQDVRAARDRYVNYDLVLIDTIGCSARNTPMLKELAALLSAARLDEVHLILEARASRLTHESVLRGFRSLNPTHLLLSKLDEVERLDDTLAAAHGAGLPLSYVTTGQRVPDDLQPADVAQLTAWVPGGS